MFLLPIFNFLESNALWMVYCVWHLRNGHLDVVCNLLCQMQYLHWLKCLINVDHPASISFNIFYRTFYIILAWSCDTVMVLIHSAAKVKKNNLIAKWSEISKKYIARNLHRIAYICGDIIHSTVQWNYN